ncbi:SAM-dependent methyltransferase [Microbacterium sp. MC2]
MWPFLYFAGERLSTAELTAARLDGDVVEIGEGFMPADAVETRELRAASLRGFIRDTLAVTHESAAWVHGALAQPPSPHLVQRVVPHRIHHVLDTRLRYRDLRLPPADVMLISGLHVASPVRTLVDLVREAVGTGGDTAAVEAMCLWRPTLPQAAITWLENAQPLHHKRAALAYLRERQEVVTR